MLQNQIAQKELSLVGEEISHELGARMVKDFQDARPTENTGNYIGRNILEKILSQPGCQGINFYNAINEMGKTTVVYVGVDASNHNITEYFKVNNDGELVKEKGIVADRVGAMDDASDDGGDWGWV